MNRIRAIARHDLRVLKRDPAFLIIFTVTPIAFMAFNESAVGAALSVQFPNAQINGAAYIVPAATVLFSGFLVGNVASTGGAPGSGCAPRRSRRANS